MVGSAWEYTCCANWKLLHCNPIEVSRKCNWKTTNILLHVDTPVQKLTSYTEETSQSRVGRRFQPAQSIGNSSPHHREERQRAKALYSTALFTTSLTTTTLAAWYGLTYTSQPVSISRRIMDHELHVAAWPSRLPTYDETGFFRRPQKLSSGWFCQLTREVYCSQGSCPPKAFEHRLDFFVRARMHWAASFRAQNFSDNRFCQASSKQH